MSKFYNADADMGETPRFGPFKYKNSLERPFLTQLSERSVRRIAFDASRYGDVTALLQPPHPLTEAAAVREAERHLSEPLTESDLKLLVENECELLDSERPYTLEGQFAHEGGTPCRGYMVGAALYLESLEFDESTGTLTLQCGS